jgi:2-amino-4-hydroxy-6-hydroxymethyldihydropteridine diphosphokinase
MTSKAWLSLGANLGDPIAQLTEAVRRIDAHEAISVLAQSTILRTKPWGKTDQPDFTNLALTIQTSLAPFELLDALQKIELDLGRVRKEVWGPRVIDIDIVAFDHVEIDTERLTLPHRFAHERDFVLDPLREIDADIVEWIIATAKNRAN